MTGSPVRRHLVISGRVQGVFFRAATEEAARGRGVAGWVRNLPGGEVEAVFEGDPDAVAAMVEWAGHGPAGARVEDVRVSEEAPGGASGFEIR